MLDKTIDSALLNLRKQITQGDGKGRQHVEALLRQRGVAMPRARPARVNVAGKGVMARMALDALRDGPQTARYVSEYIAARRPEIAFDKAHVFIAVTLTKLKKRGLVQHDGRFGGLWCLVQDFGPDGCLWAIRT
tara:strand:- start:527 stop:928 length:402 start_codon:yes stop_codon:yes gene_type:complete